MDVVKEDTKWRFVASADELQHMVDFGSVSPEGIIYHWELAGPHGADYILFPADHHTKEDIQETKDWMRNSFDVIHLSVGHAIGEYPLPKEIPTWTPEQREEGFRKIVETKGYAMVENCILIDLFTARAVVQVLDALSPENKAKMLTFDAVTMVDLTWKLLAKQEVSDE